MDFFSGSATTAEAIFKLNEEDGGFPSYLADEEDIEEGFARDEWGNEDGFDCDSDE